MDYLIFGGFGYLGSRIIEHFSKKNINITIATCNTNYCELPYQNVITDYRDINPEKLSDLVKKYDLVIDCSGISGSKIKESKIAEIIEINSIWPIKLAKACIKANTKLIWFSTIHCKNLDTNKVVLRDNIYEISKKIAEDGILEIPFWEKHITLIRLGNIIGSPGKFFNGNSDIFPINITKNLIKEGKAIIKSNPNNKIAFLEISKLLNSKLFEKSGFYSLYGTDEISLYYLAKSIQKSYYKITKKESKIIFQGNILEGKYHILNNEIKKEIELMVNFFCKKLKIKN